VQSRTSDETTNVTDLQFVHAANQFVICGCQTQRSSKGSKQSWRV